MDERQTKIREGAGLEESRINTDLIEFLNKWSSPVLIVIGLIGLGWFGWNYLQRTKIEKVNTAYAAYEAAIFGGNPSPTTLRSIADEYDGVGSVAEMALLRTVDIYLLAAVARVEPGAQADPVTGEIGEDELLDDERVQSYLSQARDLSRMVVESTRGDAGRGLLHVQGLMRLGASLEGLGSLDEAKANYTLAADAARAVGFPELAGVADRRAGMTDRLAAVPTLPNRDALAPLPGDQPVDAPGTGSDLPMNFDELMSMPFMNQGEPEDPAEMIEEMPAEAESDPVPPITTPATGGDQSAP